MEKKMETTIEGLGFDFLLSFEKCFALYGRIPKGGHECSSPKYYIPCYKCPCSRGAQLLQTTEVGGHFGKLRWVLAGSDKFYRDCRIKKCLSVLVVLITKAMQDCGPYLVPLDS